MNKQEEKLDIIGEINELDEKYVKLLQKNKRRKIIIIIITLLIIVLIILLAIKIGKIGFYINMSGKNDDEIPVITITDDNIDDNDVSNSPDEENSKNDDEIQLNLIQKNLSFSGTIRDTLDIFKNTLFGNRKIIAPESKGVFEFYVRNSNNSNINYNISFSDELGDKVNMKYKLKLNGKYVKGIEDKYVYINEINMENSLLPKNSSHLFALEWYWESDDTNDTFIGSFLEDQYYKLQINIVGYKTN